MRYMRSVEESMSSSEWFDPAIITKLRSSLDNLSSRVNLLFRTWSDTEDNEFYDAYLEARDKYKKTCLELHSYSPETKASIEKSMAEEISSAENTLSDLDLDQVEARPHLIRLTVLYDLHEILIGNIEPRITRF